MSKKENDIFIAGVGAAAGGLRAIPEFLDSFINDQKDFAVVICQHHITEHTKELVDVIKKMVKWPFEIARHGMEIKTGFVYLVPPRVNVTIAKKTFCLTPAQEESPAPSIDLFFDSMATEFKTRAIGILLSGYGNDGSEGAKTIKEKGGYMICQTPGTAEQCSMPEAVIVGGYCDADLPPGDIFTEICEYIKSQKLLVKMNGQTNRLHLILEQLAINSGTDFSLYKPSTIQRRVAKRLEKLNLKDIDAYYRYISKTPAELDDLFKIVLIGVTEFFRNPESYQALESCLSRSLRDKKRGDTIRIWSVGCARGQEAYSLAILLNEILKDKITQYKIQIFATDVDSEALNFARKGVYKRDLLKELRPELIDKYFEKTDGGYEIKKDIRRLVLFSKHDITLDPPFVRLDMIVCRNLLIYFSNELQRETLKLFHYVLNKDGLLFLGKSESVSVAQDLFEIIDNKNKLFRRAQGSSLYALQHNRFRRFRSESSDKEKRPIGPKDLSFTENAKETLFSIYEHPYVIINNHYQVKKVHGSVRLYLEIGQGNMDANILRMVNPEFNVELRALLAKTQKTGELTQSKIIKFKLFDRENFVRLKVSPLLFQMHKAEHYMIIFEKIDVDPKYISLDKQLSDDDLKNLKIQELEEELASSRDHIQAFAEELETSNEELQSLNEELQSTNEELKSSNEELETSNEEMQSANEELNAANAELRQRNDELLEKEAELRNSALKLEKSELLYRTLAENMPNSAMGLVGKDYKIEFIAGNDFENYNLTPAELRGKKIYHRMRTEQKHLLKKLVDNAFKGRQGNEIIQHNGLYYTTFMIPIMDKNKVESVMFLHQNITEQRKVINKLRESEARFRHLTDTAPVMVWMSGLDKRINHLNKAWLSFTGRGIEQELGEGWKQNIHPEDVELAVRKYEEAFDRQETFSQEYRLKRFDGEYIWIMVNGVPRYDHEGNFLGYIGGCTDIHAHKELENKKDEFMNIASHELKTPLTTAKAYFQLVEEMISGDNGQSEIKNYVQKALESLNKLTFLVDDLLDITRIEAGKLNLVKEEVDLDAFVMDVVSDYSKIIERHKIKISGSSQKIVLADKRLLEQVIVNLISNAVKFSPEHEQIDLQLSPRKKTVLLTIKDHGIGIAKEDLEKIFEPFFQTRNRKFRSGLGLGLFICKGIIEKHGGEITAESELGYGASFNIRLPSLN